MRALVSGGMGFIGTHLVSALNCAGVEVVVVDRNACFRDATLNSSVYIEAELLDRATISSALVGVDVVYHLAWSGLPLSSNDDPCAHVASNLAATLALLEECVRSSVRRVVFLSSGGAVYGHAIESPITEEHPTHPLSIYGVTKLAVESYLDFYWHQYGLDYVILRPSVPYGEAQNTMRGQGAVGVFLHCALTGAPVTLWGGRNIARDFFYVGDLAKACVAAADKCVGRGAYNLGAGSPITLGQLLDLIEGLTNKRIKAVSAPARPCDPPSIVMDITKARRYLGWEPEVTITQGIERTWAWLNSSSIAENHTPTSSSIRADLVQPPDV